jgi:predicted nucleic acid-binding protein
VSDVTVLDSSAILRLCFREGNLSLAERAMSGVAAISEVANVEVPCAIHARRHRGELPQDEAARLLALANALLGTTVRLALSPAVLRAAAGVAEGHLVRALDAIHLGTVLVTRRQQGRRGHGVRFCTADLRQAQAAIALLGPGQVDVVPPL